MMQPEVRKPLPTAAMTLSDASSVSSSSVSPFRLDSSRTPRSPCSLEDVTLGRPLASRPQPAVVTSESDSLDYFPELRSGGTSPTGTNGMETDGDGVPGKTRGLSESTISPRSPASANGAGFLRRNSWAVWLTRRISKDQRGLDKRSSDAEVDRRSSPNSADESSLPSSPTTDGANSVNHHNVSRRTSLPTQFDYNPPAVKLFSRETSLGSIFDDQSVSASGLDSGKNVTEASRTTFPAALLAHKLLKAKSISGKPDSDSPFSSLARKPCLGHWKKSVLIMLALKAAVLLWYLNYGCYFMGEQLHSEDTLNFDLAVEAKPPTTSNDLLPMVGCPPEDVPKLDDWLARSPRFSRMDSSLRDLISLRFKEIHSRHRIRSLYQSELLRDTEKETAVERNLDIDASGFHTQGRLGRAPFRNDQDETRLCPAGESQPNTFSSRDNSIMISAYSSTEFPGYPSGLLYTESEDRCESEVMVFDNQLLKHFQNMSSPRGGMRCVAVPGFMGEVEEDVSEPSAAESSSEESAGQARDLWTFPPLGIPTQEQPVPSFPRGDQGAQPNFISESELAKYKQWFETAVETTQLQSKQGQAGTVRHVYLRDAVDGHRATQYLTCNVCPSAASLEGRMNQGSGSNFSSQEGKMQVRAPRCVAFFANEDTTPLAIRCVSIQSSSIMDAAQKLPNIPLPGRATVEPAKAASRATPATPAVEKASRDDYEEVTDSKAVSAAEESGEGGFSMRANNVVGCTIASRLSFRELEDWVAYHILAGFEHIYVYEDLDEDFEKTRKAALKSKSPQPSPVVFPDDGVQSMYSVRGVRIVRLNHADDNDGKAPVKRASKVTAVVEPESEAADEDEVNFLLNSVDTNSEEQAAPQKEDTFEPDMLVPPTVESVLAPYVRLGLVTHIKWIQPHDSARQRSAMNECINRVKQRYAGSEAYESAWVLAADVDEYLAPGPFDSHGVPKDITSGRLLTYVPLVNDMVTRLMSDGVGAVYLPYALFGAPKNTVVDAMKRRPVVEQHIQRNHMITTQLMFHHHAKRFLMNGKMLIRLSSSHGYDQTQLHKAVMMAGSGHKLVTDALQSYGRLNTYRAGSLERFLERAKGTKETWTVMSGHYKGTEDKALQSFGQAVGVFKERIRTWWEHELGFQDPRKPN